MVLVCVFCLFVEPLGAIAKSARAAGISINLADKYAVDASNVLPGNHGN